MDNWTVTEAYYASLLVTYFCYGTLPGLRGGESLPNVLAQMLRCALRDIYHKFQRTGLLRVAPFVRTGELAADGVEALAAARAAFLADRGLVEESAKEADDLVPSCRRIQWTGAEERYLVLVAARFYDGTLPGLRGGESLGNVLADVLSRSYQRIRKKYQGTGLLRKRRFVRTGELAADGVEALAAARAAFLTARGFYSLEEALWTKSVRALVEARDDELFDSCIVQGGGASGVFTVEALANVDVDDVPRAKWITGVDDNDALAVALLTRWRNRAREFALQSRGEAVPREYLPAKANFGPGMFLADKEELYGTPVGVLSRATIGDEDLDDLLALQPPRRCITTTPEDRSGKRGKTMVSASGRCDQLADADFEQARKTEEAFAKLEAYRQRTA